MTTSLIEQLTALQEAVYEAAWLVIEVETREAGWTPDEARDAHAKYKAAKEAYKTAFGMEPEWKDEYAPGLPGMMPLAMPTQQRLIELCGSEAV